MWLIMQIRQCIFKDVSIHENLAWVHFLQALNAFNVSLIMAIEDD